MDLLFLDTETTGLDYFDQVIEIAICDIDGQAVFHSRCKPTVPIHPKAEQVHGISLESLADAPQWIDIEPKVLALLTDHKTIIFNSEYDLRLITQSSIAFGLNTLPWSLLETECAMIKAASIYGATNRHGTISLAKAVQRAGIPFTGPAHSALGDAATTAALWQAMQST